MRSLDFGRGRGVRGLRVKPETQDGELRVGELEEFRRRRWWRRAKGLAE